MAYLKARRYGLTSVDPTDEERASGWRQVWVHPSGLRAMRHPVTGCWHVSDGYRMIDQGWSSSLRAVAAKIERVTSATTERVT